MNTEQAEQTETSKPFYSKAEVEALLEGQRKQDREFNAQIMRALPGGITKRVRQHWIGSPDALKERLKFLAEEVIPDMFMPMHPFEQLKVVKALNGARRWGFSEADFIKLGEPPYWPTDLMKVVVLEVSLENPKKTFLEALVQIEATQEKLPLCNELRSGKYDIGVIRNRASSFRSHQRGLKWRIVDLVAHWDGETKIRPCDLISIDRAVPSHALLWARAFFPKWLKAMDRKNVPSVILTGYLVGLSNREQYRVYIYNNKGSTMVGLTKGEDLVSDYSIPEFVWQPLKNCF